MEKHTDEYEEPHNKVKIEDNREEKETVENNAVKEDNLPKKVLPARSTRGRRYYRDGNE